MRSLRSVQKRDQSDHRFEFKNLIEEAREAAERGYSQRAMEIWTRASARFPDLALLFQPALDLLVKLRLFDDAEALMNRARKQYPNVAHPLEGLALIAYKRGDRAGAIGHCEVLRKSFPTSLSGYWIAAASLSELGRSEEAEETLAIGLKARPDDTGLRIEYAKLAERRRDWDEALRRWTDVLETYGHSSGAVGIANAFTQLGQYQDADQLLSSILYKWGNDLSVWVSFVNVAEHQQDWEEVARRWETVRRRFPLEPMGYLHALASVLKSARPERADEILHEGIERMPYDSDICVEYARLAHNRGDWDEAGKRWAVVREKFPERAEGYAAGAEALANAGRVEESSEIAARNPLTRGEPNVSR